MPQVSGMILWIPFILEDSGDTNIKEKKNKHSHGDTILCFTNYITHIHIILNAGP